MTYIDWKMSVSLPFYNTWSSINTLQTFSPGHKDYVKIASSKKTRNTRRKTKKALDNFGFILYYIGVVRRNSYMLL